MVQRRWLVASVCLGILLNPLNSSMVAVAIPRLQKVFGIGYAEVSWIILVFYLASAVAQPVMGRLSDLFGRRRIFLLGLGIAFLASVSAPLSPNFACLLTLRVVQAVGTSMVSSVGLAIIRVFITERQASALAVLSAFLSGAAALGPALGGLVIHSWDWPPIFLINLPIIAASFGLGWRFIPLSEAPTAGNTPMTAGGLLQLIDAPGILLFSIGMTTTLVGFLSDRGAGSMILGLLGIGLLAVLTFYETKARSPLIPVRTLVKFPRISLVNLQFVLVNLIFYSTFFGFPAYLQSVLHLNDWDTGLVMLCMGLASLAASPIAGRWIEKSGPRRALVLSGVLMLLGSLGMVFLTVDSPVFEVALALAAFGVAGGLNNVGIQTELFRSAPKEIIGVASGMFQTSRYVGTILSSLLLALIFGSHFGTAELHILGVVLAVLSVGFLPMAAIGSTRETRKLNGPRPGEAGRVPPTLSP